MMGNEIEDPGDRAVVCMQAEGGKSMEQYLNLTSRPAAIFFFRVFGLCLLLAGLIAAVLNVSIGGVTPVILILLGLGSFMGAICNTFFAIRKHLEAK
jgi:hypothetical protein